MLDAYMQFGGIEVVNSRRAYLLSKQAGVAWLMGPSYPGLAEAIGQIDTGPSKRYSWSGTAGSSASVENDSDGTVRTNVCTNPSGEYGTAGWVGIPGTTGVMAALSNPAATTSFGTKVLHGQWTTASTALGGGLSIDIPIAAGQLLSVKVGHVLSSIVNRLQLQVEWRTAIATISSVTSAPQNVMVANTAQEGANFQLLNQLAPATTTLARVKVISVTGTGSAQWSIGSFLELDGVQANIGATLDPYFDGDTPSVISLLDPTAAPWYDSDQAELCSRFYGVYGLKMTKAYDSTRSVVTTENAGDGGVLGLTRKGMRTITVSATILATGRDALEYGRVWLAAVLELAGCAQSDDCGSGDVLFYDELPTDPVDAFNQSRFLKAAATTSGPFAVNEYGSRGVYNTDIEWSWTSERPYIYGPDRQLALTFSTSTGLVQDAPINFVMFPAPAVVEDEVGYTDQIAAVNVDTNPSVESATTNWAATQALVSGSAATSFFSSGADVGARAFGSKGFMAKIAGDNATSSSGVATGQITHDVDITGVPAGRLVALALWAASVLVAGTSTGVGAVTVTAQFLNSSNVQQGSTATLTADPAGSGVYSIAQLAIPATSTKVRFFVSAALTWSSGTTDAANGDVRLYADAGNVVYGGSV